MNDLPSTPPTTVPAPNPTAGTAVGSMAKEVAPQITPVEVPQMTEIGKDTDLSPEVKMAGVSMQADTIELPHLVQKMGVSAVGPSAPPTTGAAAVITLPLTDDQIAQGLHQSLLSSWRWLAQWCERQLKQAHVLLSSTKGKTVRTNME